MMQKTKISWATHTANPVDGLCPVGCSYCYERRRRERFHLDPTIRYKPNAFKDTEKIPSGSRIFVDSIIDLFADEINHSWLVQMLQIISENRQHTFVFLTKKPKNMRLFFGRFKNMQPPDNPISNLWLGVTITNQEDADERIPILLSIPAAVRFVSVEPMLGKVNLIQIHHKTSHSYYQVLKPIINDNDSARPAIDWIICGGMTGPGAQLMDVRWARDLRNQCRQADVPFFFKALGGNRQTPKDLNIREYPK